MVGFVLLLQLFGVVNLKILGCFLTSGFAALVVHFRFEIEFKLYLL